jgi:hypothetical protein
MGGLQTTDHEFVAPARGNKPTEKEREITRAEEARLRHEVGVVMAMIAG